MVGSKEWKIPYTTGFLTRARPSERDDSLVPYLKIFMNSIVLQRELGLLTHAIHYGISSKANKQDEREAYAYFAHAKTELSDVLTQCRLLCELMGWDYQELLEMGEERYLERMQELKDRRI